MPTLRAHLVQIKILENHQNGKDTHLRGLQIFARNDEDTGGAPATQRDGVGAKDVLVADSGKKTKGERMKKAKAGAKKEKYELGSGIGIGAMGRGGWDTYGGDVR